MEDLKEWLNYHHLRYFHAVAREGSISKAALKLNASQPSICAQIKQLEAALGEVLYTRRGRSIALTDFGRTVYGFAEEIFTLGKELLTTARRAPGKRPRRLQVGVVDSFPKLLSLEVLRPVFSGESPVHVTCSEGKIDELLPQLAAHRLDVLLSDEPPPSGAQVKSFNHPLGESGVTFCAAPPLAKKLPKRFPQNLNGAPMILPAQNTLMRRDLERWFRAVGVEPRVVADCEDAAFAKILASEGFGVTAVPTAVVSEAVARYGFVLLGKTLECVTHLYLITAERRLEHPAVEMMLQSWVKRVGKGKTLPPVC
ncbi:MAG: LysR family transcriptional regulator [Verrucomicrobia bacterium]|nr:LysR family transcriptional regulator [Verrucomicrobiota bacterium]